MDKEPQRRVSVQDASQKQEMQGDQGIQQQSCMNIAGIISGSPFVAVIAILVVALIAWKAIDTNRQTPISPGDTRQPTPAGPSSAPNPFTTPIAELTAMPTGQPDVSSQITPTPGLPLTWMPAPVPPAAAATDTPHPRTETPALPPTATDTSRPPTNTPAPPPSNTPVPPSATPSRPRPTNTRAATSTPRPTVTLAPLPAPRLFAPADGATMDGRVTFSWQWSGPALAPNQAFEVRMWLVNTADHNGLTGPVRGASVEVDLSPIKSGDYLWTVAVVQVSPYLGIGPEAPPHALHINEFVPVP